jgi:hypothetical protein
MPGAKVATRGAAIKAVPAPITPTDGAATIASQATFER